MYKIKNEEYMSDFVELFTYNPEELLPYFDNFVRNNKACLK